MDTQNANHQDDLRRTFQRHLPRRIVAVARRIEHFRTEGWDINGLALIHADVQRLAGASGRHGLVEASELLLALESLLDKPLSEDVVPNDKTSKRIVKVVLELQQRLPVVDDGDPGDAPTFGDVDRVEAPPPAYWQRWTGEATTGRDTGEAAPETIQTPGASGKLVPDSDSDSDPDPDPDQAKARAKAKAPPEKSRPPQGHRAGAAAEPAAAVDETRRLYHLGDGEALSCEIDQCLEAEGFEVESIGDPEEFKEVISALPPDLLLIDASFCAELESIGAALVPARQRSGAPMPLLAICQADTIEQRLSARRARVDALIVAPTSARDVLRQIHALLAPHKESPYRVLIVEDDRSQGLFAESILRNAGMEARVVEDPLEVLPTMAVFAPDLLLMDLHMPKVNGMELTGLIRERAEFIDTPIVFLSGESDQDMQFEALEAGGDDFIAKPVRPRHLIAAVQNRIRRARAAHRNDDRRVARDPVTGLYRRSWLLGRINNALDDSLAQAGKRLGGLLFLEVEGAVQLRERLGLSALEQVLSEAGRLLVDGLGDTAWASRFGDASFLILSTGRDDAGLEALAQALRTAVAAHPFVIEGKPLRLRVSAGVCALAHGFVEAGALLTAVERCCRAARASERGVTRFEPRLQPEQELEAALLDLEREAVDKDGFELLYQPIVAVQGSDEAQYQTQLRLRDASGRLHTAAALVPLAERAGLIIEIDRWVVSQSLRVIAEGHAGGRTLRLFVPQSGVTLTSEDQADWLGEKLKQTGVPGSSLVIEIRFSDAMIHAALLTGLCRELIDVGVHVCLCQFEHGPETRQLVHDLRPSYVKLVGKYLAAGSTQEIRDELRVLINELHAENIKVVGHRVEDAQAAATLWMSGIDFIQGNLVQQADSELDFDFQSAVL